MDKAGALRDLGSNDEAIAAYDEYLRRFGQEATREASERIVTALAWKAHTLGRCDRREQALSVYDPPPRPTGRRRLRWRLPCAADSDAYGYTTDCGSSARLANVLCRWGDAGLIPNGLGSMTGLTDSTVVKLVVLRYGSYWKGLAIAPVESVSPTIEPSAPVEYVMPGA